MPEPAVNGASGIAVGMATNIPPHNLGEICDAVTILLDNPEISTDELTKSSRARTSPPAASSSAAQAIKQAYGDGRGRIVIRARTHVEETRTGRAQIIVTELPYQVNKAPSSASIAELVKARKIEGISDLRDESRPPRHAHRHRAEARRPGRAPSSTPSTSTRRCSPPSP